MSCETDNFPQNFVILIIPIRPSTILRATHRKRCPCDWITLCIHDMTNCLDTKKHKKKDKIGICVKNSFGKEWEGTVPGVSTGPDICKFL